MSLETWKKEFYPVPAFDALDFSNREALEHALRKWQGLRIENVKKHGLTLGVGYLKDDDAKFGVDATTCALCFRFLCSTCPLTHVRGVACDAVVWTLEWRRRRKMTVIARICAVGFLESDAHTAVYSRRVKEWIDSSGEGKTETQVPLRKFKWAVGDTFDEAKEKLRAQLAGHFGGMSWLGANLEDFYFQIIFERVGEDGLFWCPMTTMCSKYRVSDGEAI